MQGLVGWTRRACLSIYEKKYCKSWECSTVFAVFRSLVRASSFTPAQPWSRRRGLTGLQYVVLSSAPRGRPMALIPGENSAARRVLRMNLATTSDVIL